MITCKMWGKKIVQNHDFSCGFDFGGIYIYHLFEKVLSSLEIQNVEWV